MMRQVVEVEQLEPEDEAGLGNGGGEGEVVVVGGCHVVAILEGGEEEEEGEEVVGCGVVEGICTEGVVDSVQNEVAGSTPTTLKCSTMEPCSSSNNITCLTIKQEPSLV
mmetsp:Transcript_17826/g.38615  ORF Transcript_17826/g.38615 Transcript_17826/m.38615 type:complete len:109 (-) Transcript_17826:58-384(-)